MSNTTAQRNSEAACFEHGEPVLLKIYRTSEEHSVITVFCMSSSDAREAAHIVRKGGHMTGIEVSWRRIQRAAQEEALRNGIAEPEPAEPRPGESELDYFERVVKQARENKARRFLEWNREQTLRDGK